MHSETDIEDVKIEDTRVVLFLLSTFEPLQARLLWEPKEDFSIRMYLDHLGPLGLDLKDLIAGAGRGALAVASRRCLGSPRTHGGYA